MKTNGHEVKQKYLLRLFVTGQTPRSVKSIENLKRVCERYLKGRYELEVIDIYQQPDLATENQIIAAPTLIKKLPLPLRRLVGDFSNQERVEELEETLRAIRMGEVDAVLVSSSQGDQVFTLQGAEHPYRLLVETIEEGAATLSDDGTVLYSNKSFAAFFGVPLEKFIGAPLQSLLSGNDAAFLRTLIMGANPPGTRRQLRLNRQNAKPPTI